MLRGGACCHVFANRHALVVPRGKPLSHPGLIRRLLGNIIPLAMMLVLTTGCASIDFDYPRPESTALNGSEDTKHGRQFAELIASKPAGESGFYLLGEGIDALATRLSLIRRVQSVPPWFRRASGERADELRSNQSAHAQQGAYRGQPGHDHRQPQCCGRVF